MYKWITIAKAYSNTTISLTDAFLWLGMCLWNNRWYMHDWTINHTHDSLIKYQIQPTQSIIPCSTPCYLSLWAQYSYTRHNGSCKKSCCQSHFTHIPFFYYNFLGVHSSVGAYHGGYYSCELTLIYVLPFFIMAIFSVSLLSYFHYHCRHYHAWHISEMFWSWCSL